MISDFFIISISPLPTGNPHNKDYTAVKNTSVWSVKNATSVNTETKLPAGEYYFVVKNDNIFTTKTVTRTVAGK